MPALLVQFEPRGAWRSGPATGERERVDPILHSDTLFAALCNAFAALGEIDAWLSAAAEARVRVSSLFPWQGEELYVPPPLHIWPPQVTNLRAHGAAFVPLRLVAQLIGGQAIREEHWRIDGLNRCLHARHFRTGPFRIALRSRAAVDRLSGSAVEPHRTACLEFADDAGLWCAAEYDDPAWEARLQSAFRWLADSGLGGERSSGWGQAAQPRFRTGVLAELLGLAAPPPDPDAWWLLSLLAPGDRDTVDWSRGAYETTGRGRWDSAAESMVCEGSVVAASSQPHGKIWNAGTNVVRSGLALGIPVALPRGLA